MDFVKIFNQVIILSFVCAIYFASADDDNRGLQKRSWDGKSERRSRRRPGPPPYALWMEPIGRYSQIDPLYPEENNNRTDADPDSEPSNNIADLASLYQPPPHHYSAAPYHHGHYYEAPEPIIEIIVKESNESLPTPPAPPTLPPTKEPVHVFYIKYKKNPNPSPHGGDDVIYEPPVPAITPPPSLVDQPHSTPPPLYHVTSPPSPPAQTTTLRTVIRPDSEIYHGSGLRVTFGASEVRSGGPRHRTDDFPTVAAESRDSTEAPAASHHFKRQQPYDPRQFGPLSPTPSDPTKDYSTFSPSSGRAAFQPSQPTGHVHRTDFFQPPPLPQQQYRQQFGPPQDRKLPPPTAAQIQQYQQQKEQLHRESLRQQALHQRQYDQSVLHNNHSPNRQPPFRPIHVTQSFAPQQQPQYQQPLQNYNPPQPYRQYRPIPQYRPQPTPLVPAQTPPPQVYPTFTTSVPIQDSRNGGQEGQFGNRQVHQGFLLQSPNRNYSIGPKPTFGGPEIVKSISQSEEHTGFQGSPRPPAQHKYVTPQSQNSRERQPQHYSTAYSTTTQHSIVTQRPFYRPPEVQAPVTLSTTESNDRQPEKENPKKDSEADKKKSAANLAALPDEVPEDLREQLLSSGILGNADIQILDYDKVGDIPIENLPPEALENLYGAGSAPVPSVVLPDQKPPVEMKVVRYDPNTEEGQAIAETYVREDATQLDPVLLNDSRYNRYLPLKVSGNQFPIPDAPQLKGRIVNSVVVLAPVDYDLVQPVENIDRTAKAIQVQKVRFIAGESLKELVKNPTLDNYNKWFDKEKLTPSDRQSVVLLVTSETESRENSTEIFMYDVGSKKVSKLRGELSSAFVEVAESNSANGELDGLSEFEDSPQPTVVAGNQTTSGQDMHTSASENRPSVYPKELLISSGYSKMAANSHI